MAIIRTVVLALLLLSLGFGGSSPSATAQENVLASNCTVYPDTPYNSGWQIVVSGWWYCNPGSYTSVRTDLTLLGTPSGSGASQQFITSQSTRSGASSGSFSYSVTAPWCWGNYQASMAVVANNGWQASGGSGNRVVYLC